MRCLCGFVLRGVDGGDMWEELGREGEGERGWMKEICEELLGREGGGGEKGGRGGARV